MNPARNLQILQHALGVDQYGRGSQYRRHFVAGPGSVDFDTCQALVSDGLMSANPPSRLFGGGACFLVTPAGAAYVAQHSPAPPKLTRSQERYERFLQEDGGMRFGEWLLVQSPRFKASIGNTRHG